MHVHAIDHVEFYVGDADAVSARLRAEYGFRLHGHLREHPGARSVLLSQGDIRLVVTSALDDSHPAAGYVVEHGDGLATIALSTDDPAAALAEAVTRGAVVTDGRVGGFGDVGHVFVRPGELFAGADVSEAGKDTAEDTLSLLDAIDHVAAVVGGGELDPTVDYYENVLGFKQIFEERIEIGGQAMNSKVVQSISKEVTLTLFEPDTDAEPGQIDDFLAAHHGSGVQHLAFRTDDIATAVRTLSDRGVTFLTTPAGYYDALAERVDHVAVPIPTLRELNVLVDQDNEGELFQIFTQTTHPRRTIFFELIERLGALTFGSANIKALYQAVERERTRAKAEEPAQ
ncbi:4-hydroxyphenylpyruvate dioxygenase [Actinokineospora enzanensis]|uniref:4-hydroxyphenylpyruvate dioxygenase n=1 Tax=Actinokineospora enzanensis TaxID=155975 RepID=UPI00037F979A|nr:4-hydroxyphenylpyruvate dioxygenase [Actinokineospora enzanensis]